MDSVSEELSEVSRDILIINLNEREFEPRHI